MALSPVVRSGQKLVIRVVTGVEEREFLGLVRSTDETRGLISVEIQNLTKGETPSLLKKQVTLVGRSPDVDLDFPCTVIDEALFPVLVFQKVNRRINVRINALLQMTYRKIDRNLYAADPQGCLTRAREEMRAHAGSIDLMINCLDRENLNPVMLRLLPKINRKLDRLIGLLGRSRNNPPDEPAEVNISGSGIRFTVREEIHPGQRLAVGILLPASPPVSVTAVGEAIRVNPKGVTEWEVAMKFTVISETDREQIIRFVFKQIRALARNSRSENARLQSPGSRT